MNLKNISFGSKDELKDNYELVIIGGGPGGMTAGIYAARSRIDHAILEATPFPGGQILNTQIIENYPGFDAPLSGYELMEKFKTQASNFGAVFVTAETVELTKDGDFFEIATVAGDTTASAVIISTGAVPKRLGAEDESKFIGKGVSFCATCDAPLYKNKVCAVIGGGDSAVEEAMYLTKYASKVYLIHRRDSLRAAKIAQERLFDNSKIEVLWSHLPVRVLGENYVEGMELESLKTGARKVLAVDGIFVYVGILPNTKFIQIPELKMDDNGFIITDAEMCTNIPGLFACGDVRQKSLRQVSNAVGEGATAEHSAEKYLEGM